MAPCPRPSFLLVAGLCLGLLGAHTPASATAADADGDLMPDAWEHSYGFNPADPADADADPDQDRLKNRDEYFAGTDPVVYTAATAMSERQLLRLFQGKAFLYFWEQSRPPFYFTPDRANYDDRDRFTDNFNSIAATGFAIMSYVVADDLGWVSHQAAYDRIRTLLSRAMAMQDASLDRLGVPPSQQGNRHGYLYHFVDNQGFRHPGSEISTIDHALFMAGAITAGLYYQGTEVEQLSRQLAANTDWNWLFDGSFLYQGWLETPGGAHEGGVTLDHWNRYSELLILEFLAMGPPDGSRAIPASAWDALTYGTGHMFPFEFAHLFPGDAPQNFAFAPNMPNTIEEPGFRNSATEFHYLHAGSLHTHQYSHLFADFRVRRDRYHTDFFANSISATMANRQFCVNLNSHAFGATPDDPQPYDTYGPNSWGLMAGVPSFTGYAVLQPIVMSWDDFSTNNIAINNDSGTVVLSAPLGSVPFTPRQTVDFTRHLLARFQAQEPGFDALIGRYGFRNAFNLGRTYTGQLGHFPDDSIGLDLGPIIGSAENFISGLIWKFAMRDPDVARGMQQAGFITGPVEPFILNFDDNPPEPQEDPNGGGQDPHSFGGASYAFGTGSVAYVDIGDPFPDLPFGPQQWAQRISAGDAVDSGAFALLNNHSVSQWDRLSFWIRGQTGMEAYAVGLKDRVIDRMGLPLQAVEVKLPIAAYHPAGHVTADWTEVRIPLRDFADRGVRLTEIDNISLTNLSPSGGTIEIDDIAFLGDAFPPAAPQNLTASVDGTTVALMWEESPEPDVVGYRILRSDDGGTTFVPLGQTLVVATTYTDPSPGHGAHQYRVQALDNAQPANVSAPATVAVAVNQPPHLDPSPAQTIAEGQPLSVTVTATDPDHDSLIFSASGLPPGATFVSSRFTWTPDFTQAGDYPITFRVSDGLAEDTELVLITVTNVPAPDLSLTALTTTATALTPGALVHVSHTVRNVGAVLAPSSVMTFHLSLDAAYGGSDDRPLTETRTIGKLASGSQTSGTTTLTIPATTPLGFYFLCASADGTERVAEDRETNNSLCTTGRILITRPELSLSALEPNTRTVTCLGWLSLTVTLANTGTVSAAPSTIQFRLSQNTIVGDADDRVLSPGRPLAMGAATSRTVSALVRIPSGTPSGVYYVCGEADATHLIVELDESNNTRCSASTVTVSP